MRAWVKNLIRSWPAVNGNGENHPNRSRDIPTVYTLSSPPIRQPSGTRRFDEPVPERGSLQIANRVNGVLGRSNRDFAFYTAFVKIYMFVPENIRLYNCRK